MTVVKVVVLYFCIFYDDNDTWIIAMVWKFKMQCLLNARRLIKPWNITDTIIGILRERNAFIRGVSICKTIILHEYISAAWGLNMHSNDYLNKLFSTRLSCTYQNLFLDYTIKYGDREVALRLIKIIYLRLSIVLGRIFRVKVSFPFKQSSRYIEPHHVRWCLILFW